MDTSSSKRQPVPVEVAKYRLMEYMRTHFATEVTLAGDFHVPRELMVLPPPGLPVVVSNVVRGKRDAP